MKNRRARSRKLLLREYIEIIFGAIRDEFLNNAAASFIAAIILVIIQVKCHYKLISTSRETLSRSGENKFPPREKHK